MDKRNAALLLMHRLRAHKLTRRPTLADGVVFSAHRVQPGRADPFQPNSFLTITPEFLETVILHVRRLGFEIVSLDEAHARLLDHGTRKVRRRPFVCFTFDDGYRDNRVWAYPVLAKHNIPHTIFVPIAFADGRGVLWWELIERVIAGREQVECEGEQRLITSTTEDKRKAFPRLVRRLVCMPPPEAHADAVRLAAHYGIDSDTVCRELIMSWDELADYAKDPLLTVGGHTVNHYRLAQLKPDAATAEMEQGLAGLELRLGKRPNHFSYPFGDRSSAGAREYDIGRNLGLKTAVTTNSGVVYAHDRLTALPRLSLNRVYCDVRCLEVLISGVTSAFSTWSWRELRQSPRQSAD